MTLHIEDDLADLVDGDAAAIDRNAEHLASCDDCRDARHDGERLVARVSAAGTDYTPRADLVDRLLAAVDASPSAGDTLPGVGSPSVKIADVAVSLPAPRVTRQDRGVAPPQRRRRLWIAAVATTAAAAGLTAYAVKSRTQTDVADTVDAATTKVIAIERAAADHASGLSIQAADGSWQPVADNTTIPAGAVVRTDERTRASLGLSDGTRLVLDHRTELAVTPKAVALHAGRVVTDGAATIRTPLGEVTGEACRFATTVTDATASIQVVRGNVDVTGSHGHDSVRAGEEATIENGAVTVAAVPNLSRSVAWSELGKPPAADDALAGLGALRAYKPGESRDRDWKLALANHDVKIRIVGPLARTEITETFRNDSANTLEGVYQFPLPPDAKIDELALDDPKAGGFIAGAFVDKERGAKIFRGVIEHATPHVERRPNDDIVWVQGPWKDPALLDWKRGGRFELHVFPIPAHGSRTIKLAYTQVVAPRGPWRQYVYPLAHASDGSTVADQMSVDVEIRGASPGLVRASGYDFVADPARTAVEARTFHQAAFVPRGDLVVDYRAADTAELRAWTFAGGSAIRPDDSRASKRGVGIDPAVVAAQRAEASDVRPTAVLALAPVLPRWREDKPRDYEIVIDASQSMVGERYHRASELAVAMIGEMDRRDRVAVMTCDSECRGAGEIRVPSAQTATEVRAWLASQTPAGASDIVESVRAGAAALTSADRERWVLYLGDGFASTGFRRTGDVEAAIAMTTATAGIHVSTIGVGNDADDVVLASIARGGGGSFLAWRPGESVGTTAVAGLESTYGTALRDATVVLPAGLADVAPTVIPTIRAGDEVLIGARVTGDVAGDVIVRGTVGNQPFEQRYPLKLAVSSASGNGFVPRLWASLAIEQLERSGRGDDRARMVALSQGYGVLSRETSLLVLESAAMFDAFGIDQPGPRATWTGEDKLDEVDSNGAVALDEGKIGKDEKKGMGGAVGHHRAALASTAAKDDEVPATKAPAATRPRPQAKADPAKPADNKMSRDVDLNTGRPMIPMRRVWERVPSATPFDVVNPAIVKAIADGDAALAQHPDSREAHRALVQALAYAGRHRSSQDRCGALARARQARSAGARLRGRSPRTRRQTRARTSHARRVGRPRRRSSLASRADDRRVRARGPARAGVWSSHRDRELAAKRRELGWRRVALSAFARP